MGLSQKKWVCKNTPSIEPLKPSETVKHRIDVVKKRLKTQIARRAALTTARNVLNDDLDDRNALIVELEQELATLRKRAA